MPSSVLPQHSTILVTGANGFIASHIVQQALKAGYKVRGTTRSADKLASLKAEWDKTFGDGKFEIAVVPDLLEDGALDEAMQGVSAVAHVASVVSFGTSIAEVVEPTVAMTINVLKSAASVPSIKRVVLTSSSIAAAFPQPDVPGIFLDDKSWNEDSKTKARELPDSDPSKPLWVYAASKTEGEQAFWKWAEENKPSFEFNTVLPNLVIGAILDETSQHGSTAGWVRDVFNGKTDFAKAFPPQYFVNAEDTAIVHLGALTLPQVVGQRLWDVSAPYNWDDVLAVYRKLYPSRQFPANFQSSKDLSIIDNSKATAILKEFGRERWATLEESLEQLVGRE